MKKIKILSPAKINLNLIIKNKRKDDFHNISSLIQPINLYDEILIELSKSDNTLELSFPEDVVSFKENLITKAVFNFFEYFKISTHVKISVKKRIPTGAGLGGGSSNAASTLIGLSKLFSIDNFSALEKIALKIGSDVPFFLYSRTSLVTGRGEVVEPCNIDKKIKYLLIFPKIHSDTRTLYQLWDSKDILLDSALQHRVASHLKNEILINKEKFLLQNDFTPLLISKDRTYLNIFNSLRDLGLRTYSISGSGSTIFCALDDEYDCSESLKYLESNSSLTTMKAEAFEGWHFTFD
ncbi:4-(cytidine 5'-diphospho)-2-C-methyl-D-erythritol kinase [bacterium]|nr:4-(cytidine 5'-diphospho)-2-C-methyl-D-erythritol kinase [bacterium]